MVLLWIDLIKAFFGQANLVFLAELIIFFNAEFLYYLLNSC